MQRRKRRTALLTAGVTVAGMHFLMSQAGIAQAEDEVAVPHSDCAMFGPKRDRHAGPALDALRRNRWERSALTIQVANSLAAPASHKPSNKRQADRTSVIDRNLFQAMQEAGV